MPGDAVIWSKIVGAGTFSCAQQHVWMNTQLTYRSHEPRNICGCLSVSHAAENSRTHASARSQTFSSLRPAAVLWRVQCQSIARLVVQLFGLRKFQGILQCTFLGVVKDPHRQVLFVHTNVADTKVGKQWFRGL